MENKLNIGIVGAGGFATFAAHSFIKVQGIQIVAVTDIDPAAAQTLAGSLQARHYTNYSSFLSDSNIDLVYIATPPYLHYSQSKAALQAGKHVICEKPAALKTIEAQELANIAAASNLLYVVNLMQRYNPLYSIVDNITRQKTLGEFLHGYFENYATDEPLPATHWFWDKAKSGGIFIEHGVHFFDMFAGWLGQGKLVNSMQVQRPGFNGEIIDRVQASVMYGNGIVNFYHGFNQPKILDRQELKLQFEKGDITLYEWVPVKIKINGLLNNDQLEQFRTTLKDCTVTIHNKNAQGTQQAKGLFKDIYYDHYATIEQGSISEKMNRYAEIIIAMIQDQWQWIINRGHKRIIDSTNAIESLRVAEDATNKAALF